MDMIPFGVLGEGQGIPYKVILREFRDPEIPFWHHDTSA